MSARSTFRRIPVVGQVERSTYVVYVGFLLIFAVFAVLLRDEGFLTVSNLLNIVQETAPVTVMPLVWSLCSRRARSTSRSALS